ncbi:MAG: hypothetical protein ABW174_16170 [Flavitalea sp.]
MKQLVLRSAAVFGVLVLCSSFIYGIFGRKCGIKGYVYEVKGNQMPSPGEARQAPKGIVTEVYIYELTGPSQVTNADRPGFYKAISTKLVKQVTTDDKGYFKVNLPDGKYSVFTKADSLYYANIFDQDNKIYPVEVFKKKFTDVIIKQDFNAAY